MDGNSPRVVAVGPLPPPYSGLSVAFAEVVEDLGREGFDCQVVDIAGTHSTSLAWYRPAIRAADWVGALAALVRQLARPGSVLYLTLGQSRTGVFRDAACVAAGAARG